MLEARKAAHIALRRLRAFSPGLPIRFRGGGPAAADGRAIKTILERLRRGGAWHRDHRGETACTRAMLDRSYAGVNGAGSSLCEFAGLCFGIDARLRANRLIVWL